jgi:hypothetical protein
MREGEGKWRKLNRLTNTHNITTKIVWLSTYPLQVLVAKEDYG